MTVMEALQWANNKLRKAGVDSPMLDAEILLSHTLEVSKSWLFSHFTDPLKTHQREKFHLLVDRRTAREPVAYLVGKKSFYGRDFHVNTFVLIPRPETEVLVEAALEILKDADPERTLLADVGTGSGAIAVTLACETELPVIAIDIDASALSVAKQNAALCGVADHVDFKLGNLAEPLVRLFKTIREQKTVKTSSVYPFKHLIVTANLPYLPESRIERLEPEIRSYEPHLALASGTDGLDHYFELFRQIHHDRKVLPRRVSVIIEIEPDQRAAIEKTIHHDFPAAKPVVQKDLHGHDRVVSVEI
ncbi:peptide chain release factor N(5)-glutamine methyltransferase [Candidatus Uhrbacteria bacterium]|nr:peptide chain release factor N(5)-glutamine methyltransferase [Candidatus Uhrbacteria bacterium]